MKQILSWLPLFVLIFLPLCPSFADNRIVAEWTAGARRQALTVDQAQAWLPRAENSAIDPMGLKDALENQVIARNILLADWLFIGRSNLPANAEAFGLNRKRQNLLLLNARGRELLEARFREQPVEVVRASHILITSGNKPGGAASNPGDQTISPEKLAFARETLSNLMKSANPETDFSNSAVLLSEDRGSAVRGGDLGYFGRGQMVPEFEAAVFGMRESGLVAEPVRSQFGLHLIRVTDSAFFTDWKSLEISIDRDNFNRLIKPSRDAWLNSLWTSSVVPLYQYEAGRKLALIGGKPVASDQLAAIPPDSEILRIGQTVYRWKDAREIILIFLPAFTNSLTAESWLTQLRNFASFQFFVEPAIQSGYVGEPSFRSRLEEADRMFLLSLAEKELTEQLAEKAGHLVSEKGVEERYAMRKAEYLAKIPAGVTNAPAFPELPSVADKVREELKAENYRKLYADWSRKELEGSRVRWNEEGLKALSEALNRP